MSCRCDMVDTKLETCDEFAEFTGSNYCCTCGHNRECHYFHEEELNKILNNIDGNFRIGIFGEIYSNVLLVNAIRIALEEADYTTKHKVQKYLEKYAKQMTSAKKEAKIIDGPD